MGQRRDGGPVIAVDGGGTRCRLSFDGRIEMEIGPTNVATDRAGALRRLVAGLGELTARAGAVAPAYLGLAGCISARIAEEVAAALPVPVLAVEDDRPAAVRGALGTAAGAVAHCGTGSFIGICGAEGAVRLVGGWGSVLGDEASAHWIAREALTRTLEVVDGLRPQDGLTQALLDRFGGAEGIVAFARTAPPEAMAALAPEVTGATATGAEVLRAGADHIARTLARLGHRPPEALCLTGGIAAAFAPYLGPDLAAALRPPAGRPLDGALAIAREMAARR
ncbi:BadF/BadG/BcrA/BcrD ATPase family protein [Falsirhodobacter algicola]|uniref:ATPase n=1 Tax=Falsirhodobacter algicola TaxID=2692330 RepID=A0A8J8MUN8_9RHOB|nr:BadF/BadG/BcrA/BcrD ATPase family protein [Falsirhodobacter algicola]QUS37036.1 ATPase [Falsirhodobacter algicola]